ncbi:cytochrome c [Cytophagaceae bacterium ABcell3]|nr:cytochrome c [Cytophagaceae bacterium ABcell3]
MRKLTTYLISSLVIPIIFSFNFTTNDDGEKTFTQNCTACHTIGGGDITGPDLKNITENRDEEWLIEFIKSPQKMIKNGDKTANDLFNKYNQVMMPDQNLSDAEIKEVLDYITKESAN